MSRPSSFVEAGFAAPRPFAPMALPVLIQVPALRPARRGPRPARRPSEFATARVRANMTAHGRVRPRRRLRKGVKVAVTGLLAAAAFACAAWTLGSGGASVQGAPVGLIPPPSISLTVEGARGTASESEATVLLQGYVLPDDGFEEPDHAGGR